MVDLARLLWHFGVERLKALGFYGWATREGSDKSLEDTSKLIDQLMIGVA